MEVYALKIDKNIKRTTFYRYLTFLTKKKQLKIMRLHRYEDALRSLIADILLRTIVAEKVQISNKDIIFINNEYGKPFLKMYDNFEFNISHSDEWVVCAIDNYPVGIDVQKVLPIDLNIAKQFFTKIEYEFLETKDASQKLLSFYDLWSLKESYVKADGKGLSIPLDSFSIIIKNEGISLYTENEFRECFFKQYHINNNYKLSVCGCENDFCSGIIHKEINEVLQMMLLI